MRTFAPTSINHSLICLRAIMKQAVKDGYINSIPCQGVEKLTTKPKGRGALTEEEGTKLFADPPVWKDLRHYWICRLSYELGMRFGEVVVLKRKYVENGWINVVHSWGRKEGLKDPKTKESKRRLKVSKQLTSELKKWMKESPFQDREDFVFYTPIRELPYFDKFSLISRRNYAYTGGGTPKAW